MLGLWRMKDDSHSKACEEVLEKKLGLEREEGFEDSVSAHYYDFRSVQCFWESIGKVIGGGSRLDFRLFDESNS